MPVLNRPHRVAPLLDNIAAATPEPHDVVFIASDDDEAEIAEVMRVGRAIMGADTRVGNGQHRQAPHLILAGPPGTWAQKINVAYRQTSAPFIFTGADDLTFHGGWLGLALDAMRLTDPAPGVVGTNDDCNNRTKTLQHATHSLVRRAYVEDLGGTGDGTPGVVLHEGYPHDYADDELVEVAKSRGRWMHAGKGCVVEHLHPLCGKGEMDATYELGMARGPAEGRRIFEERRALWGGSQTTRTMRRPGGCRGCG